MLRCAGLGSWGGYNDGYVSFNLLLVVSVAEDRLVPFEVVDTKGVGICLVMMVANCDLVDRINGNGLRQYPTWRCGTSVPTTAATSIAAASVWPCLVGSAAICVRSSFPVKDARPPFLVGLVERAVVAAGGIVGNRTLIHVVVGNVIDFLHIVEHVLDVIDELILDLDNDTDVCLQ